MLSFLAKRSFAVAHRITIRPVTLSSPLRHFWVQSVPSDTNSKEDSTTPYPDAPNTLAKLFQDIGKETHDSMKESSPEVQWARMEKDVVGLLAQPHTAYTGTSLRTVSSYVC